MKFDIVYDTPGHLRKEKIQWKVEMELGINISTKCNTFFSF